MKKLLILCLLLVGCNVSSNSPHQNKELTRLNYINSLSLEKTKELLIVCVSSRYCGGVVDEQIMYDQYTSTGVQQ
jgi:hypothetical protein